jgi:murein DD-endopeptidase MepM/ murein hydrolase activator NlpD
MGKQKVTEAKFFTLMMVPHDNNKVYSLKIANWAIYLLGAVCLGVATLSAFIITRHVDYELTKRANLKLSEKNSYCVQELAKTHEAFQRVAKVEEELRAMLKLKDKNAILKYTGSGGPTPADNANLISMLSSKLTLSPQEFATSLGDLEDKAKVRMESYRALKKYIATQRSLLASKPSAWPVRGWITSRFGPRLSPFSEGITFHQGLDIANEIGTAIKAPASGVVTFSGWQGGYGKLIVIDHGYGYQTRFGHLDRSLVNVGQRVQVGQTIGFLGNTGRSTAPHLHYEVRVNGMPVSPLKFLEQ